MVRSWSIVLGIGLAVLWVTGMSDPRAPAWMAWLIGVASLGSFLIAGSASEISVSRRDAAGPFILAAGLLALWAVGLLTGAAPWIAWWTFAFACANALLGFAASRSREEPTVEDELPDRIHGQGTMDRARDRFSRSA
jgi:hypothetical protein